MTYANPFQHSLTGLEIKDWVWHHSHSKTQYTKLAKRMGACFNLDDDKYYMAVLCDGRPFIKEVPEKGILYEVPCDSADGG